MSPDTIYVTGATGFIGRHLVPLLAQDRPGRVVTVGRHDADLDYATFARTALQGGSTVIHLAGQAHDLRGDADAAVYEAANVGLTRGVYDAFVRSDAAVFIFASSVKAVSDLPQGALRQDDVPHPRTPYGQSKLRAEQHITAHPPEAGRRVYVLRPCVVVGPGVKGNLALLDFAARRGVPMPLGRVRNQRSVVSIDNVAHVVQAAIEGTLAAGTYNLADDEPLSTADMVRELAAAYGRSPRVWSVPVPFLRMVARVGDFVHLPLNSAALEKLTGSYVVDNTALRAALGRDRLQHSARDGIRSIAVRHDPS